MATSRDIGTGPVRERHSAAGGASGGARLSTRQLIAREWKALRDDPPGQRFRNHHRRMRDPACRTLRIAALVVGPILAAAGVIMLLIPGPGLLFIVAGVALLCGQSERLAGWLDRREPELRRALERARRRWRTLRPRP
jgi:hypothetical protein